MCYFLPTWLPVLSKLTYGTLQSVYRYRETGGEVIFIIWVTMAQREGFYLILPSDGSIDSVPNNTAAQFKIFLPQSLDLTDREWEVS